MLTAADQDAQRRWVPWYGIGALLLGVFIGLLAGVVAAEVGHAAGYSLSSPPPAAVDSATLVQDLAFVGAAVLFARMCAPVAFAQFGLSPARGPFRAALLVLGALLAFLLFSAIWTAALHINAQEKQVVRDLGGNSGTLGVLAAIAVTCVLAPVCEEVLFRGFMFRALANWRGPLLGALITGVVFGAVHVGSAPIGDIVPLAFFGTVLCGLYQRTGSLYPGIALHALNNSLALGVNEGWSWQIVAVLIVASLAAIAVLLTALTRQLSLRPA